MYVFFFSFDVFFFFFNVSFLLYSMYIVKIVASIKNTQESLQHLLLLAFNFFFFTCQSHLTQHYIYIYVTISSQ